MHPQNFIVQYPHRKITQSPKMHFGDRVRHWMANNFETKLHINNRRFNALGGTLRCQPPKALKFGPKMRN